MKCKNIVCLLLLLCTCNLLHAAEEHPTLAIGAAAPDFKLKGTDDKSYSLSSFSKADILVVVFTCNHCPTAQAYEDRLIQLTKDYAGKNVSVVAIMPNDDKAVRLDELGYTDMNDSFEEMKLRAKEKGYNFPYLYDGTTQSVTKAYGAVATPHIFIFDKSRKLRYQGRIDNVEKPTKTPTSFDTRNAIEALLAGKDVPVQTTKVFGCSIKWTEKENWLEKANVEWAKESVSINMIDEAGIKDLVKNSSDKLRLINIWATWCGPCVAEFSEFITINRMYRNRDFELVFISADEPDNKEKTIIERTILNLLDAGIEEVIVVTGYEADKITMAVQYLPVRIIYNTSYEKGMTTSIQKGVASAHGEGFMICLADMYAITAEEYSVIKISFEEQLKLDKKCISIPRYNNEKGNPVIFAAAYKDAILQHADMEGCKAIVRSSASHIHWVEMDNPHILEDLDYPEDYKKISNE